MEILMPFMLESNILTKSLIVEGDKVVKTNVGGEYYKVLYKVE